MPDLLDRFKAALADRYAIQEELGAGGMATVYLARDLKHSRKVAVKVLRSGLAAAIGPERFLREIEIAANLNHPHILPLFDSGEAEGFLYYVMPYVKGESLRDRLNREKQLPVDDALQIAREVADALGSAHKHDVIHRDIKPENILLEEGHAVVADFGIARAVTVAGAEHTTQSGTAIGTPEYMSPEQALGSTEIDGRSDVYSLGCVVFEMLCGEPPFTGPTPQAVVARQISERPPSISIVRPQIPPGLQEVIERALAKVPVDRYQTPDAFSTALADAATAHSERRPVLTQRSRWVAAVSVVAVVVSAVAVWRGLAGPSPRLDSNIIVQYPLEVSGVNSEAAGGEFQLGEDVAYFIVGALDGKGTLTWLNGRDLLQDRYLYGDSLRLLRHSEKSALAVARGAGFYVDGRVVLLASDSVRVFLELHSVEQDLPLERADTAGSMSATANLGVLAMGELLLSLLPTGQAIDVSDVSGLTPQAIQGFVQGERSYRRGMFMEAFRHFQNAVEEDSAFALAALKAAQAAIMLDSLDQATSLVDTALAHLPRLSPRNAQMVRGFSAYQRGQADVALHHFRSALALDRTRPEALMAIGQTFRHLLPVESPQDSLSDEAFAQVYRRVAGFTPVLPYLVSAELRRNNLSAARRYLNEFRAAAPESQIIPTSELMFRCVEKTPSAIDWQAEVLADVDRVFQVARSLHIGAAHPPCAHRAWEAVVAYDTSSWSGWRFSALLGLQSLLIAMGRFDELVALLDSAAASGTPVGKALQDLYIVDELAGVEVGNRAARQAASLREDLPALHDIRLWLLGLWDAYHGKLAEARAIRDTLTSFALLTVADSIGVNDFLAVHSRIAFSWPVDAAIQELTDVRKAAADAARRNDAPRLSALREREHQLQSGLQTKLNDWRRESHRRVSRLEESLSAHIALASGDTTVAIRQLELMVPTAPRPPLTWDPWEGLGLEWMLLARQYFARGDYARAIELARRFDAAGSVPNLMYLPASLSLRMRAAEALGDEQLATRMRQRLIDLRGRDLVGES